MRHGLMQKTIIPLNPQIETNQPKIWKLVSSITICYILKVIQNVIKRPNQVISRIWTEFMHNLKCSLDIT